jgi:hypothetical protein
MSTMPKSVMPCQVSWQLVVMKSAGSAHGRGAAVASASDAGALVGTTSAAHASAVYELFGDSQSTLKGCDHVLETRCVGGVGHQRRYDCVGREGWFFWQSGPARRMSQRHIAPA